MLRGHTGTDGESPHLPGQPQAGPALGPGSALSTAASAAQRQESSLQKVAVALQLAAWCTTQADQGPCCRALGCSAAAGDLLASLAQACSPESLSCAAQHLHQAAAHLPGIHAAAADAPNSCQQALDPGLVASAAGLGDSIAAILPDAARYAAPQEQQQALQDALAASPVFSLADAAAAAPVRSNDWLSPISNSLEWVLDQLKLGLDRAHVPYSYGWAIVGLTLCTKTLTYPLTKLQVRRACNMEQIRRLCRLCCCAFGCCLPILLTQLGTERAYCRSCSAASQAWLLGASHKPR